MSIQNHIIYNSSLAGEFDPERNVHIVKWYVHTAGETVEYPNGIPLQTGSIVAEGWSAK